MALTTGWADDYGRTVAAGFGVATSGQTYTINGTAADFSVGSGIGVISPTTLASDYHAVVDLNTVNFNVAGQVAVSALPATSTIEMGLAGSWLNGSNGYKLYLAVTTAGAATLIVGKRLAGVGSTVASVSLTGVTIVAGTFYNLRFARFGATFYGKFWSVGSTEPYGWSVVASDTGTLVTGTQVGDYARNNSAATGIAIRFDNSLSFTHSLPYPASTDPMCYDPTYAYPRQTAVQSLAQAVDNYLGITTEPDAARASLRPRVRVSKSNFSQASQNLNPAIFDTVEYNVGTNTDLSVDPFHIILPPGVWILHAEIIIPPSTTMLDGSLTLDGAIADFRIDAGTGSGLFEPAIGASNQVGIVSGSGSIITKSVAITCDVSSGGLSFTYLSLSAIKLSDWF